MFNGIIKKLGNYKRYFFNEIQHKLKGDKRCEFEKIVQKSRFLELKRIIHNPGECSCVEHIAKGGKR